MGNQASNGQWTYADVETPAQVPGESAIYRNPISIGKDLWKEYGSKTLQDLYKRRFEERPNEIGFSRRKFDREAKKYTNEIENFTNRQFQTFAEELGSGILNMELVHEVNE